MAAPLPSLVFAALLVLCRIGAAVAVLPGLGEAEPPAMLRIGLAGALSLLLLPDVAAHGIAPERSAPELVRMIATEFATGLFLGWLARLIALAMPIAGQFISVFTGLSSVLQPDPALGAQSSALARLFSLAAPVLLLTSGLYALPLQALVGSYRLIPLGGTLPAADAASDVVTMTGEAFGLAFRLAAPFVLAATLWQVSLGLVSRFAPTLQAGSALLPGQVLGGMVLLALLARTIVWQWGDAVMRELTALPGLAAHG